jgi:ABC-type Fe3+ transport system substrate-binding protein
MIVHNISTSLRAKRSNPGLCARFLDCFVATLLAMTTLFVISATPARADWKADWDSTVAAAKKEGSLILSVPSGRAWRDALAKFQDAYPDIKTEMTPVASRDFWPRIVKEHEAGQYLWDLRIGGIDAPSYNMKNKGELAPVKPLFILPEITDEKNWGAGFDGLFLDKEKKFFPAFVAYESQSVYYNKAKLGGAAPPTMQTLDAPQWAGKISMADPRGGAALNTLTVMNKLFGDEPINKLMAQKPVVTGEPRQMMDWLASGRYPIAFGLPSATFVDYAARGASLDDFVKVQGLHIWSPGVGAIEYMVKAPHPNASKVFVNWLLSKDTQTVLMQAVKLNSQRIDVPKGDPSEVVDVKAMGQYTCTQAEDLEPFEQHVVALLRTYLQ